MSSVNKEYKTLARIFHADRSAESFTNHEVLARLRLEAASTFRTGIIVPSGELFVAMPREMSILTEEILLNETRIAQLWGSLPDRARQVYIDHAISEEIFASNEMEGVRSTRRETAAAVEAAKQDTENSRESIAAKGVRFGEFARLFFTLTSEDAALPATLDDIRMIYDKITYGEIDGKDLPDGHRFRKGDVDIHGMHGVPIHSGVSGETQINILLTEMIRLMSSHAMPRLHGAIIAHFLFEYIHPFYDGNGRTGRYLLALYLSRALALPTVLSLSRIIAENKKSYYKAFTEAEEKLNCGELTFFVDAVLGFISHAQEELANELGVSVDKTLKAQSLCSRLGKKYYLSAHAQDIFSELLQREFLEPGDGIVSLEDASRCIRLTKQSARFYINELYSAGFINYVGKRPLKITVSDKFRTVIDTGQM